MVKKILIGLITLLAVLVGVASTMNRLAPATTAKLLREMSRSAAGLESKTMEVQGKVFPYLSGGTGDPLILVHGFTANKDAWDFIARYLTPRYTVYAPDLPGFGDASRDPNADYSYDAQVENLHAFIKGLGLTSVHLGGSSMGGGVVARYAAKYPNEVASLWLLDAAATQESVDSALMKHYIATGEFPLLVKTQDEQTKQMEMLFAKPKFIPYSVAYDFLENSKKDFDLHSKILKNLVADSAPIESRFSNLQTPSLIVTGEQDRIIPPASAQTLARVFPKSQVKVMPGVGHIPMAEDPKTTAADYLAFRATLSKAT
jgi:triacylglycerol lipase